MAEKKEQGAGKRMMINRSARPGDLSGLAHEECPDCRGVCVPTEQPVASPAPIPLGIDSNAASDDPAGSSRLPKRAMCKHCGERIKLCFNQNCCRGEDYTHDLGDGYTIHCCRGGFAECAEPQQNDGGEKGRPSTVNATEGATHPQSSPAPMTAEEFYESGQYHGDSDFSLSSACQFAEAFRDATQRQPSELRCGHPASLEVASVESGKKFCELCEMRSERNDAVQMEKSLSVEVTRLNEQRLNCLAALQSISSMLRGSADNRLSAIEVADKALAGWTGLNEPPSGRHPSVSEEQLQKALQTLEFANDFISKSSLANEPGTKMNEALARIRGTAQLLRTTLNGAAPAPQLSDEQYGSVACCPQCNGSGRNAVLAPCRICKGRGTISTEYGYLAPAPSGLDSAKRMMIGEDGKPHEWCPDCRAACCKPYAPAPAPQGADSGEEKR